MIWQPIFSLAFKNCCLSTKLDIVKSTGQAWFILGSRIDDPRNNVHGYLVQGHLIMASNIRMYEKSLWSRRKLTCEKNSGAEISCQTLFKLVNFCNFNRSRDLSQQRGFVSRITYLQCCCLLCFSTIQSINY